MATFLLTCIALIAFAANSLLARAALAGGTIDPASYTAIRLISGAAILVGVVAYRGHEAAVRARTGSWISAVAIFIYAIAFSLAYGRLGAATGAVILFASVQGTMVIWGALRADRPKPRELAGLLVAFAALVWLLLPRLDSPDPVGSALMALAGVAWGIYSLGGRGTADPVDATAGNFVRAALLCIPLAFAPFTFGYTDTHGIVLAVLSGAVTSGLGYVIWYRALPRLSTTQAAAVQLAVPVIAAFGGVALLGESLTTRLVLASAGILGGLALATLKPARRR
ncbi:MAG: EamA family transporter [Alphaproteobacteria bacterium]|nr:EamA family transporter [Alphaproteobacteria bacterium]